MLIKFYLYQSVWGFGGGGKEYRKKMKTEGYSSVLSTVDQTSILDTKEDHGWLLAKKQQEDIKMNLVTYPWHQANATVLPRNSLLGSDHRS